MKQKIIIIVFAILVASFILLYVPQFDKQEAKPCIVPAELRESLLNPADVPTDDAEGNL